MKYIETYLWSHFGSINFFTGSYLLYLVTLIVAYLNKPYDNVFMIT